MIGHPPLFGNIEPEKSDPFQSQRGESAGILPDPLHSQLLLLRHIGQLSLLAELRHLVFIPHRVVPEHAQPLRPFVIAHIKLFAEVAARKHQLPENPVVASCPGRNRQQKNQAGGSHRYIRPRALFPRSIPEPHYCRRQEGQCRRTGESNHSPHQAEQQPISQTRIAIKSQREQKNHA
jgi:hypothetical protein